MKPTIIMIQTTDAAAGRRSAETPSASSVSNAVPAAPTPIPISTKPTAASASPSQRFDAISAVAAAAIVPPIASNAIPPTIHGVRRDWSAP